MRNCHLWAKRLTFLGGTAVVLSLMALREEIFLFTRPFDESLDRLHGNSSQEIVVASPSEISTFANQVALHEVQVQGSAFLETGPVSVSAIPLPSLISTPPPSILPSATPPSGRLAEAPLNEIRAPIPLEHSEHSEMILKLLRKDKRCGPRFPIKGLEVPAICDASSKLPCCSETSGWCGNSPSHCTCGMTCIDYRKIHDKNLEPLANPHDVFEGCAESYVVSEDAIVPDKPWRGDGRCGPRFPGSTNLPAECQPDDQHGRVCCHSITGQCGASADYCPPPFGACDPKNCTDYRQASLLPPQPLNKSEVCGELSQYQNLKEVRIAGSFEGMALGNILSVYWLKRGIARLLNLPFKWDQPASSSFTRWLRNREMPSPAYKGANDWLRTVCKIFETDCIGENIGFAHNCIGLWDRIRPTIRMDTQAALKKAGVAKQACGDLQAGDVVIHSRCGADPWSNHQYSFPAFSLYDHIPKDTKRIFILAGKPAKDKACVQMHQALKLHLQTRTGVPVVDVLLGETNRMSVDLDFARLVYAPTLFRSSSSFSLWAGLANSNQVYSVTNHITNPKFINAQDTTIDWKYTKVDLGPDWHWINVPQLTNEVKAKHNFKFRTPGPWIEWLRTH